MEHWNSIYKKCEFLILIVSLTWDNKIIKSSFIKKSYIYIVKYIIQKEQFTTLLIDMNLKIRSCKGFLVNENIFSFLAVCNKHLRLGELSKSINTQVLVNLLTFNFNYISKCVASYSPTIKLFTNFQWPISRNIYRLITQ